MSSATDSLWRINILSCTDVKRQGATKLRPKTVKPIRTMITIDLKRAKIINLVFKCERILTTKGSLGGD